MGDHSILLMCLVCVFGGSDHPARTCQGVSGEGAREEESLQGREEGHTHESAAHPASGPHLESEAAALRGARGNGQKKTL